MRKFVINVNGSSYEVEVEEVTTGEMASRPVTPMAAPRQAVPAPAPTAPAQTSAAKETAAPAQEVKEEVTVSAGQEIIDAPMPGNIWKIVTSEGAMVKSGDVLVILEAMKMENEIVAPRDGKVVSITTTEGSAVNTGDKLVIME